MPVAVDPGVPLIVIVLAAQVALTPAGRPVTPPPVEPVVAYVIFVIAVLRQGDCTFVFAADVKLIVFAGVTIIVPVAATVPHPPVSGIE